MCISRSEISSGKRKLSGMKRKSFGKNLCRREMITQKMFFFAKCFKIDVRKIGGLTSIRGYLLIMQTLFLRKSMSLSRKAIPYQIKLPSFWSRVSLYPYFLTQY